MVSNLSIIFMAISAALSALFPIGLFIYLKKKEKASFSPLLMGALIWIIFSQVFEKALHLYVIKTPLFHMAVPFAIYGALAAGVFEEVGRFFAFKIFLKKDREWRDGIAYGIGHGGIEAILIGMTANINNIVYSALLNAGTLEKTLNGKVPAEAISSLKTALASTPILFLSSGLERVCAVIFHIGMTMIVLYGIQNNKIVYLFYAILVHALFDFMPALYQQHIITNVWIIEAVLVVFAIVIAELIFKTKNKFRNESIK